MWIEHHNPHVFSEYDFAAAKTLTMMPKSVKFRPDSPVASTSKDGVIRCSACEKEYCDPPTEEWIQCYGTSIPFLT
ncbi:UNVERIFIED_CONTAM: hypothetical protein NCL1_52233 [Trichonephila clavipes]